MPTDLRRAWRWSLSADSAGGAASGNGKPPITPRTPPPSPSPPAGGDPPPDDTGDEPPPDGDDNGGEDIRDPEKHRLSQEAAKHRTEAKKAKERVGELEAEVAGLQSLRLQNAFLVAAAGKVGDLNAAWKLCDQSRISVADDGTVTGAAEALEETLEKYPYLAPTNGHDDEELLTPESFGPLEPSGRPANTGNRNGDTNRAALVKRFPALGHRS